MISQMLLSLKTAYELYDTDKFDASLLPSLLTKARSGLTWGEILSLMGYLSFEKSEESWTAQVTEDGYWLLGESLPWKLNSPWKVGDMVAVKYTGNTGVEIEVLAEVAHITSQGRKGLWSDAEQPYTLRAKDPRYPQFTGVLSASVDNMRHFTQGQDREPVTWDSMKIAVEAEEKKKRKRRKTSPQLPKSLPR